MSKIGKVPVELPAGVELKVEGLKAEIKGPKGVLEVGLFDGLSVKVENNEAYVTLSDLNLENGKALWGLVRSLINNAVKGVSEGFSKDLELVGVGYRVEKVGNDLSLLVGYSHAVKVKAPEGITFDLEGNTMIKVSGIDKQAVGQTAANIRKVRKPEPYKGKGIKYKEEIVRRKQGKTAKTAA